VNLALAPKKGSRNCGVSNQDMDDCINDVVSQFSIMGSPGHKLCTGECSGSDKCLALGLVVQEARPLKDNPGISLKYRDTNNNGLPDTFFWYPKNGEPDPSTGQKVWRFNLRVSCECANPAANNP
jgi:hypothetical protein